MDGVRLCACALAHQQHQEKKRMAEDGKDESVATDDDSDRTGADGSHSLNYAVKLWLLPVLTIYTLSLTIGIAAGKSS